MVFIDGAAAVELSDVTDARFQATDDRGANKISLGPNTPSFDLGIERFVYDSIADLAIQKQAVLAVSRELLLNGLEAKLGTQGKRGLYSRIKLNEVIDNMLSDTYTAPLLLQEEGKLRPTEHFGLLVA